MRISGQTETMFFSDKIIAFFNVYSLIVAVVADKIVFISFHCSRLLLLRMLAKFSMLLASKPLIAIML